MIAPEWCLDLAQQFYGVTPREVNPTLSVSIICETLNISRAKKLENVER
jgi:hypothetical protein